VGDSPYDLAEFAQRIRAFLVRYLEAELFVDPSDGISLNAAISETIWATYSCVANRINLWIIGKPGTSKFLAVNNVLRKFALRQSANPRLAFAPPVPYQRYMCSQRSTSEAIQEQVDIVARGGREDTFSKVVQVPVLAEMGTHTCRLSCHSSG
jgi:hypothetical protein